MPSAIVLRTTSCECSPIQLETRGAFRFASFFAVANGPMLDDCYVPREWSLPTAEEGEDRLLFAPRLVGASATAPRGELGESQRRRAARGFQRRIGSRDE